MPRKWGFAYVGLMAMFLVALSGPAVAWEFGMTGSFNWTHEWYNQQGSKGFFGNYNVDNASRGTANLNFWDGGQFDTSFVSGANAAWSYLQVDFDLIIKINSALRLYGHYRLGSWGDPASSYYITQDAPGVWNAFSEGQWTQFWAAANFPWGVFAIGKRPWKFGTGLQYDGSDSSTTESMALTVPYGPFDIGIAYYPFRFAGSSGIWVINGSNRNVHAFADPYDLPVYVDPDDDRRTPSGEYYSRADRSGAFSNDFLAYVTYSNGPLSAGILSAYGSYHVGPEADLRAPDESPLIVPLDSELFHGTVYGKYNNGRFFLNSELAWLYWTDRFGAQPPNGTVMPFPPTAQGPAGGPGEPPDPPAGFPSLPQTRYIEQLQAGIETGILAGPAKISFLSLWSPGPDRRNGMYIDRQPAAFVRHPTYDTRLGNYSLILPYSFLFAYDYGSGIHAYNLSGNGFIRDAFVLAGRLDYAVAANLNLFGSFFWAQRSSDGYEWGCLRPEISDDTPARATGNVDFSRVSPGAYMSQNNRTPNITERSLGYEIGLGFNWKLLEGLTCGINISYWAPGKWFTYACIDRADPNWNNDNQPRGGTRDRSIDAVIGGMYNLTAEF
jgi:hypothetical protein